MNRLRCKRWNQCPAARPRLALTIAWTGNRDEVPLMTMAPALSSTSSSLSSWAASSSLCYSSASHPCSSSTLGQIWSMCNTDRIFSPCPSVTSEPQPMLQAMAFTRLLGHQRLITKTDMRQFHWVAPSVHSGKLKSSANSPLPRSLRMKKL